MQKGAINGLIQSLGDPHTVYISPEDFSVGIDIISGAFQGIGAQVDTNADAPIEPLPAPVDF